MCSPQRTARDQVLDELSGVDPGALGADALMGHVRSLSTFIDQATGELARLTGALNTAGGAAEAGHLSAAAFLRGACGKTAGKAGELAATGRGLRARPATAKALAAGDISFDHAVIITRAAGQVSDDTPADADPGTAAGRAERVLLDAAAGGVSAGQLRQLGEEISYRANPDAADERQRRAWEKRYLSFGLTFGGTGTLSGACGDNLCFETVRTAAEAFAPPGGKLDTRTAAQRRLDGLVTACKAALDTGQAPTRHGAAPHITILVRDQTLAQAASGTATPTPGAATSTGTATPAETATGAEAAAPTGSAAPAGTPAETAAPTGSAAPAGATIPDSGQPPDGGPARGAPPARTGRGTMLTARQVLALCCGAQLTAIRWEDGLPLDVGRTARTEPPALRNALQTRDLTCRWPGCDAPAHWCTGHHIPGWRNGARTRLRDMVLLCWVHHTHFVHLLGWTITGDPNTTLRFHHPAGCLTLESPLPGKPRGP